MSLMVCFNGRCFRPEEEVNTEEGRICRCGDNHWRYAHQISLFQKIKLFLRKGVWYV